jgi:hypothetical protein
MGGAYLHRSVRIQILANGDMMQRSHLPHLLITPQTRKMLLGIQAFTVVS